MNTQQIHVSVPQQWAVRNHPGHGIVLVARSREVPASGFPPELVVRSVVVATDLAAWRDEARQAMADQLRGLDLEDDDTYELGGQDVSYHRFAYVDGVRDIVCEQWAWLVDGVGVTLTASVDRRDYATYCDLFEDVAATVDIRGSAAA